MMVNGPNMERDIESEKQARSSLDSTLNVLRKKKEMLSLQVLELKKEHEASILSRSSAFDALNFPN